MAASQGSYHDAGAITGGGPATPGTVGGGASYSSNIGASGGRVPGAPPLSPSSSSVQQDSKERDVLNTGDLFRLRSVKFPEYELGITSKKISGDHCYLGLHKAQPFGVEEDENVWCHTTRFSARYSNTIF